MGKLLIVVAGIMSVAAASPAFAGIQPVVPIPEPSTLAVLGTAAAVGVVIYRLRNRK